MNGKRRQRKHAGQRIAPAGTTKAKDHRRTPQANAQEVTYWLRTAYPDPTSTDPQWLTCDFAPLRTLDRPVSLTAIKADSMLQSLALVRQPRLAVSRLSQQQFQRLLDLAAGS